MPTVTLKQLRDSIRAWEIDETPFPDSIVDSILNETIDDLFHLCADVAPDRLPISEQTISVIAGTQEYTLEDDILHTLEVYWVDGSTLRPLKQAQWDGSSIDQTITEAESTRYRIAANKISFEVAPSWSGQIKICYISYADELALDADEVVLSKLQKSWVKHTALEEIMGIEENPQITLIRARIASATLRLKKDDTKKQNVWRREGLDHHVDYSKV